MTLAPWMFWTLICGYMAFIGLILYLDSRSKRIIHTLRQKQGVNDTDWRTSMQVDLKQVLEILEKHLDANGERRVPYQALRLFRKDLIQQLAEMSEENWDSLQATVTCDIFPNPHTRDFGHDCRNPRRSQ